jgi:hypothetical protein
MIGLRYRFLLLLAMLAMSSYGWMESEEKGSCRCCKDCDCGKSCKCNAKKSCHEACDCGKVLSYHYIPASCQTDESVNCDIPCPDNDCIFGHQYGLDGIWLPECPPLFRPFVADPHQLAYSVGWRFNDNALSKHVIDVSYYDSLPIYRWFNIGYGCIRGDLQLDIEGCLWANFDPMTFSAPLIDADYYVGFPLTYAFDNWSFRLRGYHISTHIGDEYLLNHPIFDRKNPSAEYVDFFVSNNITEDIRLYGGVGYILDQDDSFICKRFYGAVGFEVRLFEFAYWDYSDRIVGKPYLGAHFRYTGDYRNHLDATYVLGYEWQKLSGLQRCLRLFILYHDGYSAEGQFCRFPTSYFSVRATYGF